MLGIEPGWATCNTNILPTITWAPSAKLFGDDPNWVSSSMDALAPWQVDWAMPLTLIQVLTRRIQPHPSLHLRSQGCDLSTKEEDTRLCTNHLVTLARIEFGPHRKTTVSSAKVSIFNAQRALLPGKCPEQPSGGTVRPNSPGILSTTGATSAQTFPSLAAS